MKNPNQPPHAALRARYWQMVEEHGIENVQWRVRWSNDDGGGATDFEEWMSEPERGTACPWTKHCVYELRLKPQPPRMMRLQKVEYPEAVDGGKWSVSVYLNGEQRETLDAARFQHPTEADARLHFECLTSGRVVE